MLALLLDFIKINYLKEKNVLYLVILVASIIVMVKVADSEDRSPVLWGFITFFIGCGLWFIPIPFIVGLTPVISFGIMFFMNLNRKG